MIIDSPIVSGSQLASGPFTQIGNVQITGSLSVTGTINGSITGSITSASYATYAETASYAVGYALDNNVVHLSGNQSIAGEKSFDNVVTIYESSAVRFTDNPITTTYGSIIGNSSFWQFTAGADTLLFRSKNSVNALSIDANGNSTMTSVTANSFTGSLLGTASYATNADNTSASFAAYSASVSTRLTTDEANITTLTNASSSFAAQSASLSTRITQDETNFTNLSSSFATTSGSLSTRVTNLESTSSTVSSSFASTSGSISGRVTLIEGQYATTGSNTFTAPQHITDVSNAIGFTSTASLYTEGGLRVKGAAYISGTAYFNDVVVYGTSSIEYITSSQLAIGTNIITLNTDTPSIRFGGISVFDSGSNNLSTGSLFWDSEKDKWIYSNPSASTYDGGMLISGPRNTSGLGNEVGTTSCALMMGQGGDHITSSAIFSYGNATCFYGQSYISGSGDSYFAGNIGVQNTAPSGGLHIVNPTEASAWITSTGGDYDSSIYLGYCYPGNALFADTYIKRQVNSLVFGTTNSNRLTIGYDGVVTSTCQICATSFNAPEVNIGTSLSGYALTVKEKGCASAPFMAFVGSTSNGSWMRSYWYCSDATTQLAQLTIQPTDNMYFGSLVAMPLVLQTNSSTRLTITSTGISCFACQVCVPSYNFTAAPNSCITADASYTRFITSNTERFNIDVSGIACFACKVCTPMLLASGCIGIGITSPGAPIEINSTGGLNGYTALKIKYGTTSVQSLSMGQVTAGNGGWLGTAQYRLSGNWQTEGTAASVLTFGSDGSIGINTNCSLTANTDYTLSQRLYISPTGIACFACQVCVPYLSVKNSDNSILARFSGAGDYAIFAAGANAPDYQATDMNAVLNLGTRCGGTAFWSLATKGGAAFALSGGCVGIGTQNPAASLHVVGTGTQFKISYSTYNDPRYMNITHGGILAVSGDSNNWFGIEMCGGNTGTNPWGGGITFTTDCNLRGYFAKTGGLHILNGGTSSITSPAYTYCAGEQYREVVYAGYAQGTDTIAVRFCFTNQQAPFELTAISNHYGLAQGYGAIRKTLGAVGPNSQYIDLVNSTSANGGCWLIYPEASGIIVCKSAGTYGGAGYWFVKMGGTYVCKTAV